MKKERTLASKIGKNVHCSLVLEFNGSEEEDYDSFQFQNELNPRFKNINPLTT